MGTLNGFVVSLVIFSFLILSPNSFSAIPGKSSRQLSKKILVQDDEFSDDEDDEFLDEEDGGEQSEFIEEADADRVWADGTQI